VFAIAQWGIIKMHSQLCNKNSTFSFEDEIDQLLKRAAKHNLTDLSDSSLMNRVDSKFLLPVDQLLNVLNKCNNYYSALEIQNKSVFHYKNIYFDTRELDFYNKHHNRKLNRHKVRHRNYADSGISYLEVKFKTNKGRTIKTRQPVDNNPSTALDSSYSFLKQQGIIAPDCLKPAQLCTYDRISFASQQLSERITLDLNLNFTNWINRKSSTADDSQAYKMPTFVIAELKQAKRDRKSPFFQLMRELGIRPQGFSKYCMGVSLTNQPQIKSNRFKANIIKLQRGA
jgi:hypothetical protein